MEKMNFKTFLGANSFEGFVSFFDKCYLSEKGWKAYIIKGGPGTGKSSFMKKVVKTAEGKGYNAELCPCSSDPDSLDAVITSDGMFSAADATLPHAVEPKYPGVYETVVSLSDCWDEKILRGHSEKIAELFDSNRRLHEEARRYISAAANLLEEASKLGMESLCTEKTEKSAFRLCVKEFGRKKHRKGTEKQRFLSAVTEKGVFFLEKTPEILCKRIYMLDDDPGAFSKVFLNIVIRIS